MSKRLIDRGEYSEERFEGLDAAFQQMFCEERDRVRQEVHDQIDKGVISASIAQQTALMPFYAVQILYALANTDIPMTTDNVQAGVPGVPSYIDTGVIVVDESNYRYFMRD